MTVLTLRQNYFPFLALTLLMAVTRYHHAGSPLSPPDASLAVFFLAGLYIPALWTFPALLISAAVIDYAAVYYGGVSGWCFSPAYWFLIPTYACLWYGGKWFMANHGVVAPRTLLRLGLTLVMASSAAFIISTGSFYLFSGKLVSVSGLSYVMAVAKYYPPYLAAACGYVLMGWLVHTAWRVGVRVSQRPGLNG